MDFDLSNADASFWGEDAIDHAGYSVASVGDVNGDGRADFLIGAWGDEDGGGEAGQTYLILGRAAADWGMDFDLSNADASFWGEDGGDYSGLSVASAGDVNGDGRADFLIGAYRDEDGGGEAGQTYLILGRAAADWGMDFDLSNADASFWGEDGGDYSGWSVASAGDVNGDGCDDFLIGAYADDDGGNTAGQTYLLLGTLQYDLTISSTAGGNVTEPGVGTHTYDAGTVVNLTATPNAGYDFVNWTGNVSTIADDEDATTTITMNGDYSITANFEEEPPGGGCFIATAAYGTPMAEEIQILREFRDEYLLANPVGKALIDLYYRVSPPMADFITEHPSLKPIVRAGLVPAVAMSTVIVDTTPAEKVAMIGLLVLVSVAVAIWVTRRLDRGPQYT